ncbi:fibrinogen-like YCDxxxxGGGW domain-containing protein [Streptosporangium lutulentum]
MTPTLAAQLLSDHPMRGFSCDRFSCRIPFSTDPQNSPVREALRGRAHRRRRLAVPGTASAAPPPPADGTSADKAAPSCWAIKQQTPSSADGVYWLQTPALIAPQQFYCDMTTDGGGWVLIGRGRQGWEFDYNGQRTPAEVRNTPASTGAFAPRRCPATWSTGC